MKLKDLINECIRIQQKYNKSVSTPDAHVDEYFAKNQFDDESDEVFVKQIFLGLCRVEDFIGTTLDALYSIKPAALAGDRSLYMVFSYLMIFRLEEITVPEFKRLVLCQDLNKMLLIMQFLLDVENVKVVLRAEWGNHYDMDYIDGTIIATLESLSEETTQLITEVTQKVSGEDLLIKTQKARKEKTKIEPFALTKPKPRVIPEPMAMKTEFKAKPPPVYDSVPKEQIVLEKKKKENRKRVEQAHKKAAPPTLATADRPVKKKFEKVKQEIEEARMAPLRKQYKSKPAPKRKERSERVNVRLTTTAILREDATYKKRQEAERAKIKEFEMGLRDAREFMKWQEEMKEKDDEERIAEIDRRRQDAAISAELAIEAKFEEIHNNQKLGRMMQEEYADLYEQHRKVVLEEEKLRKEKAEDDKVSNKAALDKARKELAKKRQERAAQIAKERRELELDAVRRMEEDLQRKEDLIRQIRAMEAVPIQTKAAFDPTSSSGVGLLIEMSLSELKEKLEALKRRQEAEEKDKRNEIVNEKLMREQDIKKKAQRIAKAREEAEKQAALRRSEKIKAAKQGEVKYTTRQNKKYIELQAKLEEKRKARKKAQVQLAAEARAIRQRTRLLSADKAAVEERQFKSLQLAAERHAAERQTVEQTDAAQGKRFQSRDNKNRDLSRAALEAEKEAFAQEYEARVKDIDTQNAANIAAEQERKATLVKSIRQDEAAAKKKYEETHPYEASIKKEQRDLAKSLSGMGLEEEDEKAADTNLEEEEEEEAAVEDEPVATSASGGLQLPEARYDEKEEGGSENE